MGQLLIRGGLLREEQLQQAIQAQQQRGERLGKVLIDLGYISERDLVSALSDQYGVPVLFYPEEEFQPETARLVDEGLVQRNAAIPIRIDGDTLTLGMVNPGNLQAVDHLATMTRKQITVAVITEQALDRLCVIAYRFEAGQAPAADLPDLPPAQERDGAGVIRLVNDVLEQGLAMGASDIHLEPLGETFRVRFRVDGVLNEALRLPLHLAPAFVARVKVMAHLDIAERRLPQDGRIDMEIRGRRCDLRVAAVPTIHGEKVTIRLLDQSAGVRHLTDFGLEEANLALLRQMARRPSGMLLVTGPTGSGKTTTLAALLTELNAIERHIITVEDPVEYQVPGVIQVQVNPKVGLTFAAGLRSFLRHDPDVIMVGEIRDRETAELAIRGALTGHLVLSTLHTTSAAGAVTRLIDMGIEPFLVASALTGLVAQRLVRRLCPRCRQPAGPEQQAPLFRRFGAELPDAPFYRPAGCNWCGQQGYRGRIPLFELLPVTNQIAELVRPGVTSAAIEAAARAGGRPGMLHDGIRKALAGETSLAEIQRVLLGE